MKQDKGGFILCDREGEINSLIKVAEWSDSLTKEEKEEMEKLKKNSNLTEEWLLKHRYPKSALL